MDLSTSEWISAAALGVLILIWITALVIAMRLRRVDAQLPDWLVREPVRVRAAAVTIIGALVTLLASLGVEVDPVVQAGVIGLIAAMALAISELSRPKVTPVAAPNLERGHSGLSDDVAADVPPQ